jgi:demethylmenaquinone methyltransferase / 2-methoxy-6-polyprenyl-1,4-benzoquinol methylase
MNAPSSKATPIRSGGPPDSSKVSPGEPKIDKTPDRVRKMFSEIACRYDFLNHLLSMGVDHYWRWRTVRTVRPARNAKILDVCTGTGDLALAYHRAGRGNVQIVGADFCRAMLSRARCKARKRGTAGAVTFIEADAENLPLADSQFEIVCVAFGLRNVCDADRGLAEMARVCAPGGQVAVLEFSAPGWQPLKAIYGWYFRHILPRVGQLLARNRHAAYNYLPESVGQFPQGEQLADRFRAVGLADITLHSLTGGIATLYVGTKPESRQLQPPNGSE